MTENKLRKMITGATVGATLLIACLLGVLVYQWIKIGVQANRLQKVEQELAANQQILDEKGSELGYFQSELGKIDEAMQDGWILGQGN
jgi:mannose/fructose/N-acetylgalactosamine-specific phosphotransferase system component IID